MKKFLVGMFFSLSLVGAKAQDDVTFTDEELTTYATVMVWAEQEKKNLGSLVSDSVAIWIENTPLTSGKYMDLSRADKKGDLESVEASEEELTVFNEVQTKIDDKKAAFKETYVGKIKEDIGAGLYNKLKKALKNDADLKARYDAVYDGIVNMDSGSDETLAPEQ
ncbi:MAG: hypothetical protein ABJG41_08815 [Cyclobacteriaceae bacterium]